MDRVGNQIGGAHGFSSRIEYLPAYFFARSTNEIFGVEYQFVATFIGDLGVGFWGGIHLHGEVASGGQWRIAVLVGDKYWEIIAGGKGVVDGGGPVEFKGEFVFC